MIRNSISHIHSQHATSLGTAYAYHLIQADNLAHGLEGEGVVEGVGVQCKRFVRIQPFGVRVDLRGIVQLHHLRIPSMPKSPVKVLSLNATARLYLKIHIHLLFPFRTPLSE